jgi:hypothetical protein
MCTDKECGSLGSAKDGGKQSPVAGTRKTNFSGWLAFVCGVLLFFVGFKCLAGVFLISVASLLLITSFSLNGFSWAALLGLLLIPTAIFIRATCHF